MNLHPDWIIQPLYGPWTCPTCERVQHGSGVRCWRGPGVDPQAVCTECYRQMVGPYNAELAYEPYGTDPDGPEGWAPYVRLADCRTHGLEAVTGHRIISTGYDTCQVGTFACGAIVIEDVF